MIEKITSLQNPRIKNILKLQKVSERKEQNLFIIEGFREISLAIDAGYEIDSLFVCNELTNQANYHSFKNKCKSIFEITPAIFEKVAYREGSDGLLALAIPKNIHLQNLILSENPLLIILEAVEKPGNLGAVLRTADAAKVDAVIICDPHTDIYNPNVIRSSIGCLFTNQVIISNSDDVKHYLKERKIQAFAAALVAKDNYHQTNFTIPSAIVMGTEADGLSSKWINESIHQIKIPMLGKIDSLNVSVATAILVFEAKRQRNFL